MTYRITSTDPADTRTIARFAPDPLTLRGACGVSLDLARHLLGEPRIVPIEGGDHRSIIAADLASCREIRSWGVKARG